VALLVLGLWFITSLAGLDGYTHANVLRWAASPFNSVMLLLFVAVLAWHSALGVQVVIEDYVHGAFIKLVSLLLNRFAHVILAITAVVAILRIALGSAV
jgi:succinate dehydrogenase / fumarate reductase membrane anchor subunit